MKVVIYIIRFLLALLFIYSGIEKLFLPYHPEVFQANMPHSGEAFFEFYDLLQKTGYLSFVGVCQLLCGGLLVFKKTYLLGAVMLFPLMLCLVMTHVFFSKNVGYMVFDSTLLSLNLVIILHHFRLLQATFLRPVKTVF